jgi:hypothetical protein
VGQLVELSFRHVSHRQGIVEVQFRTDDFGCVGTDAAEEFEGVEDGFVVGQVLAQNMWHPECVPTFVQNSTRDFRLLQYRS